ncbi:oral-facial-digital syndrome 1 protein homolog isoform X2 [Hypomesus transpacificus]|uniref:oral-facial-digital syndrome 1 protein homolog isoform X2 n=1 Tax=Hypomesus transpacificus TaxID=137520 RepID=UPI001F087DBC|nr:oral-facial-digital syndrome 1 protein homolog isoform X2 [Hypomesus transpacificus]
MSVTKEEALSPDELRKRLYQTFKTRGVLDTLKTQLRNQLIHELKNPVAGGENVPRPFSMRSDSVLVTASNSLVADHLRNSGYEYTLSVFYPECGLGKNMLFNTRDLLQLMKISPGSPLYKSLASRTQADKKGLLISLLMELTDAHMHKERCDVDTQTTTTPSYRESLVDKMKVIDEEYEALRYRGDKWVSYEVKIAAYRKEIEAQVQAEMNAKLQHFKEVEIAKVKMEEKERSRKEMFELKQEMERTNEQKAEALITREKHAIERLQKQQEIEEKDVYMQRQALLKEIETVRNRETELKMRIEAFEKTCQIQEEKNKTMDDLLRRRELAVKTMEDTYDQQLKNELSRYQLELKEDYVKRTEKLTDNEKRNQVESSRIQHESSSLDAKLKEHTRARSELRQLQTELDTAQAQASILGQQNELLRERLGTMSDYPSLRREKVELQAQLRLLRNQLEEAQGENQLLRADLGRPSKEQLALQAELQRVESTRRLDREECESQRQVLQAQLQSEVELCAQLKAQLIECEEKNQWMTTHAEDVKLQLRQTQQAGGPSRGRLGRRGRSSSPDSDGDLVAGAKARIRVLEKEAEALEEAYRNYQQRAVHAATSHMLPPRPLSPQWAPVSHRPLSPPRQHIHPKVSRPFSPQHPKVSQRTLSPQRLHHPASPHHSRTPPAPHPRVTFSDDQAQLWFPGPGSNRGLQSLDLSESHWSAERNHEEGTSSPSRRLSSTPLSLSRRQLQTETVEEAASGSPLPFPALSPDRPVSPTRSPDAAASSGDFASDLSSPRSPQLKSTARDQCSPPQVQTVFSSSDSSPQPEKITLEDLTEHLPEPSHIPEPVLDTAIPLAEEAPDGPSAPLPQAPLPQAPRDPPETQTQTEEQGDEPVKEVENEEEEELRWERERREREERRQREWEEAQERELRELEKLEKERLLEEERLQADNKSQEEKGGLEEPEHKDPVGGGEEMSTDVNPLEKYMKMVLETREKQHSQSPRKEELEETSPEARSVSEEKDDSIAAFSHEDVDDEFW